MNEDYPRDAGAVEHGAVGEGGGVLDLEQVPVLGPVAAHLGHRHLLHAQHLEAAGEREGRRDHTSMGGRASSIRRTHAP